MEPRIYLAVVDGNILNTYQALTSTELAEPRLDSDSLRRIGSQLIDACGNLLAPAFQIQSTALANLGAMHLRDPRAPRMTHVDGIEAGANSLTPEMCYGIRYIAHAMHSADPSYFQGHDLDSGIRIVGMKIIWRTGRTVQLTLCRNPKQLLGLRPSKVNPSRMTFSAT